MRKTSGVMMLLALAAALAAGVAAAGWDPQEEQKNVAAAEETIKSFKATEPGLEVYFKEAYAYVVFPTIGKGGLIFGGSYGTGTVFEGSEVVGAAKLTSLSVGLQAGGESFSELIFFKDKATFENFKNGDVKLSAQASAVGGKEGAGAKTSYNEGVAVFVKAKGGLMADASVGGQKFKYEPKPTPKQ
ncbi:MAG TPA: lipid-binding SYLF domain-containing protein [Thermoanaerobaculaceae bacterium]|nr:lipid-binding SYLF domain-containing protein [Thermoanaerobaculaceae bacterium]